MYLKAILPGLITGGITAIAAEWNASIVAEYFTATGIADYGTGRRWGLDWESSWTWRLASATSGCMAARLDKPYHHHNTA